MTTTTTTSGRQVETTTTVGRFIKNERRYDGEVTGTFYWEHDGLTGYTAISKAAFAEGSAPFTRTLPSDFAMFTTPGNAAVAKEVREALRGRSDFFSDHDMVVRVTQVIQTAVSARKGMEEAQDTAVGDAIYCVLSGETSAQLGI